MLITVLLAVSEIKFLILFFKGLRVKEILRNDIAGQFTEIGGDSQNRPYWQHHVDGASCFSWVVDASNPDRFQESGNKTSNK